jgi:hypothetical protein
VFGNRVLRRIFGPKRDEATGGSRKQHDVLFAKYSSMIKTRRMRLAGHLARMGVEDDCI